MLYRRVVEGIDVGEQAKHVRCVDAECGLTVGGETTSMSAGKADPNLEKPPKVLARSVSAKSLSNRTARLGQVHCPLPRFVSSKSISIRRGSLCYDCYDYHYNRTIVYSIDAGDLL
jgi:hypothetical protein